MAQKKILVADDEKALAKALELKLTKEGYAVVVAYNGVEALALIQKEHPNLILLDLVMPKMDGFGVLEALKKEGRKTPVIVTTNLGQEEDKKRVLDLGVKEYLVKSNTPIADIVAHVKKLV